MTANQNGSFAGKVAFVTGAGSGIGRATALAFAGEGASVVVADISEQKARESARMIEEAGGRALAVACDVTRSEDVKAALGETIEMTRRERARRRRSRTDPPARSAPIAALIP